MCFFEGEGNFRDVLLEFYEDVEVGVVEERYPASIAQYLIGLCKTKSD